MASGPDIRARVPGATIDDVGDGLLLRHARPEDAEAVAALNADVHRANDEAGPDERIASWTRDLLLRPHPTMTPAHTLVVEDTATGDIASTLVLIPQTWTFGGVPFGVGRIELVSTARPYRRRGLVRRQMEEVHRWSAASGDLAQAITGIPWYYRQFGYEMTLHLGGERQIVLPRQPTGPTVVAVDSVATADATPDDRPGYNVRPATLADVPALIAIDDHAQRRGLISCVRNAAVWRYHLDTFGQDGIAAWDIRVVTARDGSVVTYLIAYGTPSGDRLQVVRLETGPSTPWVEIISPILAWANERAGELSRDARTTVDVVSLELGPDHPVYPLLSGRVLRSRRPYAWYVRVPDVPAFLRHVRPVLERHLAASPAAGFTGDVTLSTYREGVTIRLRRGVIEAVEPWPAPDVTASARFPDLTFLRLLTGWRDLDELEHAFPDCFVRDEHRAVIAGLFPRRDSWIWPLD